MLGSGGIILTPSIMAQAAQRKAKKLTILHTNDTHSNIDPFPDNHSKFPGMGGVAKDLKLSSKLGEKKKM